VSVVVERSPAGSKGVDNLRGILFHAVTAADVLA
jgi:hypothetical protein